MLSAKDQRLRATRIKHGHDLLYRWWGIPPTHLYLSSGRHLPLTIMPKFSTQKIRIWAIMLKNFRISSPNRR